MITRRKILIALGAGALTAPLASFAQRQTRIPHIGFLVLQSRTIFRETKYQDAFLNGLRELGYIEGRTITIEWRFADQQYERLPALAMELANLKVDVVVTWAVPGVRAAQQATATIPIVMATISDPVGSGLVASLARPGGNTTGVANLDVDTSAKRLELLLAAVPNLSRVGVLWNPANPVAVTMSKIVQAAAQQKGITALLTEVHIPSEIDSAFAKMTRERVGGVIVTPDPFMVAQARQIAGLATKHRLPSVFGNRINVEVGGLMSYGVNIAENFRRAATYVDKILRGAKPGDLPVEQSMIFEMVINMKTAKALGITFPQSILVRADKVIE